MSSTQERIRDYLYRRRSATAAELAQALFTTKADIQYHLKALEQEGVVQRLPHTAQPQRRRGRPSILFQLAPSSRPDNLAPLTCALLDAVLPAADGLFPAIAASLFGSLEPQLSLPQALNQAVALLNRHAYQASWEARPAGPRILFKNCPYAQILAEHPELCRLDEHCLATLLKKPVRLEARIDFQRPSSACVFYVSVNG